MSCIIDVQACDQLKRHVGTLHDASYDSDNICHMTVCRDRVVLFDEVARDFVRLQTGKSPDKNTKPSVDALYVGSDGLVTLIEFKNGKISSNEKVRVRLKAMCSLAILNSLCGLQTHDARTSILYVLVYNESRNPSGHSDGMRERLVPEAPGFDSFASMTTALAAPTSNHYLDLLNEGTTSRFGTRDALGAFFHGVFTLTEREFEELYLSNVSSVL